MILNMIVIKWLMVSVQVLIMDFDDQGTRGYIRL